MKDNNGRAGPPAWHYRCRNCQHEFQMPAAGGPAEERDRTCPRCHSPGIERTDSHESEACPPGG